MHSKSLLTLQLSLPLLFAGCGTAVVERSVVDDLPRDTPMARLDFWHELAERPITSNHDALHGLALFLDVTVEAVDSYDNLRDDLVARGVLPASFNAPADAAVRRGTLADALVRALSIRGGWVMSLFGPSERYATNELRFRGIYPVSSPNQTLSGVEFLGVIARAGEWREGQR